jgi:hypothetical protein
MKVYGAEKKMTLNDIAILLRQDLGRNARVRSAENLAFMSSSSVVLIAIDDAVSTTFSCFTKNSPNFDQTKI